MAQPGLRARSLTQYFSNEYGFEAENYIAGIILYKRQNAQGVVERIVVKHAIMSIWEQPDERDEEIDSEENLLRRLWGSEHTIRLMSVVDDRYHRAPVMWAPPINRDALNPPPILPWKLRIDPARYPIAASFGFFVMEFLARGTGNSWVYRNGVSPEPRKSQSSGSRERGIATPRAASVTDIPCKSEEPRVDILMIPFTKGVQIIDFGLSHEDNRRTRVTIDPVVDDEERPTFTVRNVPGGIDFDTYATEEFCEAANLSDDFKLLVCKCLAVDEAWRPTLRPVLEVCERNVALTPNWMNLTDEAYELFDSVPLLDDGNDSGSEYLP
ncbi:hypothetical protein FHL15_003160 [Xylaria flabelliformis]|uniref:Protein kinase domain-containing protein n=1 Tax=Xylaria flabelliformis TaxID=2512241 RepID=A0A553I739_9PEZI|nr:hypothetical protein FHL15_003160 [Xylaria flabelliformis]